MLKERHHTLQILVYHLLLQQVVELAVLDLEQIDAESIRLTLAIRTDGASIKPGEALQGILGARASGCRVVREELLVDWNGRLLNPMLAAAAGDAERAAS